MKAFTSEDQHFTEEQKKAFHREGILVVIGGVFIHLILGTFYLWGGISKYVASYLYSYDSTVSATELLAVFPYMGLCINCTTSIGVKVAQKIGHKLLIVIGVCTIAASVFLCSFITNKNLFIIVYAGGFGIASGMIYMLPVECALKYFPDQKGKISGIIIAGFGMGSFIFNFLTLAIVNSDDIPPDPKTKLFGPEVYNNVPLMFRVLSICYLTLGLIGVFLVKNPKDTSLEILDERNILTKTTETKTQDSVQSNECQTFRQGMSSKPFYFLFFMALLSTYAPLMMANSYKVYGFELGKKDSFLTLVGSLQALANGFSRALWGMLMDKIGFKKVYQIILIAQMICVATLHYLAPISDILYLIWVCLIMSLEGGQFSIYPAFCMKLFGHKVGSVMYGIVFIAFALANLNSFFVLNYTLKIVGWSGLWWIAFAYSLMAFILLLFFRQEYYWERKIDLKIEYPQSTELQADHMAEVAQNIHFDKVDENSQQ